MESIKPHAVSVLSGSAAEHEDVFSLGEKISNRKGKKYPEYLPAGAFHLWQQINEQHSSGRYKKQSVDGAEKKGNHLPFSSFFDEERKIIAGRASVGIGKHLSVDARSATQDGSVTSLAEGENDNITKQTPFPVQTNKPERPEGEKSLFQSDNSTNDDALRKMVISPAGPHGQSPVVQPLVTEKIVAATPFFQQPASDEMNAQQGNLFIYKFRNSTRNWVEISRVVTPSANADREAFVLKPSNTLTESALRNKLDDSTPYSLYREQHREGRGQDKHGQDEADES